MKIHNERQRASIVHIIGGGATKVLGQWPTFYVLVETQPFFAGLIDKNDIFERLANIISSFPDHLK